MAISRRSLVVRDSGAGVSVKPINNSTGTPTTTTSAPKGSGIPPTNTTAPSQGSAIPPTNSAAPPKGSDIPPAGPVALNSTDGSSGSTSDSGVADSGVVDGGAVDGGVFADDLPYSISFVDGLFIPTSGSTSGPVIFEFASGNHSVVSSSFSAPCVPSDPSHPSSFWSGPMGMYDQFVLDAVPSGQTIFFYSPNGNDCVNGIVGVINPNGTMNLDAYQSAAASFKGVAGVPTGAPYGGYVIRNDSRGWMAQHTMGIISTILFLVLGLGIGALVLYRSAARRLALRREQGFGPDGGLRLDGTRSLAPAGFSSQTNYSPWEKAGSGHAVTVEDIDDPEDDEDDKDHHKG